jgi:hypothetical protein
MVLAGLIMDVGFTAAGLVPAPNPNIRAELATFSFNYTFWLNTCEALRRLDPRTRGACCVFRLHQAGFFSQWWSSGFARSV